MVPGPNGELSADVDPVLQEAPAEVQLRIVAKLADGTPVRLREGPFPLPEKKIAEIGSIGKVVLERLLYINIPIVVILACVAMVHVVRMKFRRVRRG